MLNECYENGNQSQVIQRLSKDYQDNSPLIFRIMDHITTSLRNQQNISPFWRKAGNQKDKNINDNVTVKFNSG